MATQKQRSPRRRGASERRTAPAKGSKARAKSAKRTRPARLRFAPSEQVFHTMVPGGTRTTCCDQDVNKVYGVTIDPRLITGVRFCEKAVVA